jgi:hypothetical protein
MTRLENSASSFKRLDAIFLFYFVASDTRNVASRFRFPALAPWRSTFFPCRLLSSTKQNSFGLHRRSNHARLDFYFISHRQQEFPLDHGINSLRFRPRPLAPAFQRFAWGSRIVRLCRTNCFHVFSDCSGLLKRGGALEQAIDAGLFEPLLPFPFRPLRLALPFSLFLLQFGFVLDRPFVTEYGPFAVLQLGGQNNLDRNLCNARFKFALLIVLPDHADVFGAGTLENRQR